MTWRCLALGRTSSRGASRTAARRDDVLEVSGTLNVIPGSTAAPLRWTFTVPGTFDDIGTRSTQARWLPADVVPVPGTVRVIEARFRCPLWCLAPLTTSRDGRSQFQGLPRDVVPEPGTSRTSKAARRACASWRRWLGLGARRAGRPTVLLRADRYKVCATWLLVPGHLQQHHGAHHDQPARDLRRRQRLAQPRPRDGDRGDGLEHQHDRALRRPDLARPRTGTARTAAPCRPPRRRSRAGRRARCRRGCRRAARRRRPRRPDSARSAPASRSRTGPRTGRPARARPAAGARAAASRRAWRSTRRSGR